MHIIYDFVIKPHISFFTYRYYQDVAQLNGNRSAGFRLLSRHRTCLYPPSAAASSGSVPFTRRNFNIPILPRCRPTKRESLRRLLPAITPQNLPLSAPGGGKFRFPSSAGTLIYRYYQDVAQLNGNRSAGFSLLSRRRTCLHPPSAAASSGSVPFTRRNFNIPILPRCCPTKRESLRRLLPAITPQNLPLSAPGGGKFWFGSLHPQRKNARRRIIRHLAFWSG